MKNNWQIKKLGEITTLIKGKKPKKFAKISNKPYLTAKVVRGTEIPLYAANDCLSSVWVEKEDIVIIMDGSNSGEMFTGLEGALASTMGIIKYPKDLIHPKYLLNFLVTHRENFTKSRTGAAIPHLNKEGFENLEIPIPPLTEQKRIVEKLDKVFLGLTEVREKAERNLKNAKELFESYLQGVFENPGENWEEKNLGDIANFRNGMNFTKTSKGQIIKIVGVRDFQKSFFVPFASLESVTIDGTLNKTDLLQEGDILTVRSNGNPELIGRTLLAEKVDDGISHSGFTIRIRIEDKDVYPVYLCHYLKSKKARELLVKSGTGTNIKSLNQVTLTALAIPLPKLVEQKTIVKKLDALNEQTKQLEGIFRKKIADIDELKKSVLQKSFAGEL